MGHYAFLDESNKVVQVITGRDENELGIDWEDFYSNESGLVVKRTSYNTVAGIHVQGGEAFRKNFAGIGFTYDETRDAFIPPKPFASWILDEDSCLWGAPIPKPDDGKDYYWSEDSQDWLENTGE